MEIHDVEKLGPKLRVESLGMSYVVIFDHAEIKIHQSWTDQGVPRLVALQVHARSCHRR